MAKTTIDGLAVRSSSVKKTPLAVVRPGAAIDMMTKRTKRESYADPLLQKIDETEELGVVRAEESNFVEANTADWSELLGEMSATGPRDLEEELFNNDDDDLDAPLEDDLLRSDKEDLPEREKDDLLDEFELDEEEKKPRRKKHHKKLHIGRWVTAAIVLLLLCGGVAVYFWGDSLISRLTGGQSGLFGALSAMVSDEIPFQTDSEGRTNVLVFGTEGYNMNGDVGNGQHDGAQLTDSIMVISFDQETKDVALLSLPRDLKVTMACSAGKINEVFWCHNQSGTDEAAGAKALMQQVGQILGVDVQYYAHVNWGSLVQIVDTLGGVTVTLDEDINDYGWTNAVAQAGVPITVNGEQALGLARARHGTSGGDFTRGNSQQKIVMAIAQKVVENGVGVNEALGLLNILGDNLRTNFSAENIKAGIRLAAGVDIAAIRQVPLVNYDDQTYYVTTANINEISYVVPSAGVGDYSEIQAYVGSMFSSNPLKREDAGVVVLNATGESGVAGTERIRLEEDGFTVVNVGDATSCEEKYCVYKMNENNPYTVMALEQRYGVTARGAEELQEENWKYGKADIVVIIGGVDKSEEV